LKWNIYYYVNLTPINVENFNQSMRNLFFLLIILIGCNENQSSSKSENIENERSTDAQIDSITTLLVTNKCAVFIFPDTLWLKKQKIENSEEDWNEIVSDATYYDDLAEQYLIKNKIPVIHLINKQFIKFQRVGEKETTIMLDSVDDGFSCWLFNPDRNPVIFKDMDIEDEFTKAFK
jgi:hypothetical protein